MKAPVAPAATLVIFGAMSDLTSRLLVPALVNLTRDGLVDEDFQVLGVSRGGETDDSLREKLDASDKADDDADDDVGKAWAMLRKRISYMRGDFTDPATYQALAERLGPACGGNAVFFLAVEPTFFGDIVEGLAKARLLDQAGCFRRVVVEKPFGNSLDAARALNARLLGLADESQIYRIDHFLGKETVRNIMVARFGNSLFEAVWNNRYVDHVQITAAETVSVGTRGEFYEATGALRDMVPNHLFQLIAMVGMEPPNSFDADAVRTERAKLLRAIRAPEPEDVSHDAVRGRYRAGEAGGKTVPDYTAEADVAADSATETYVALKLAVETFRWVGVPFYLRTGKALSHRDTKVVVVFKPAPLALFRDTDMSALPSNTLVLQVQPNEGIHLGFIAKRPGPIVETASVDLSFCYADYFKLGNATGYETLIYDVLTGDQSLFQRGDEVEAGWAAVQPVLDHWSSAGGTPEDYAAGSAGPSAADELMSRDGRAWHALG